VIPEVIPHFQAESGNSNSAYLLAEWNHLIPEVKLIKRQSKKRQTQ